MGVGIMLLRCRCGRLGTASRNGGESVCAGCAKEIAALESMASRRELESLLPWPTRMRRVARRLLWVPMLAVAIAVLLWLGAALVSAFAEMARVGAR